MRSSKNACAVAPEHQGGWFENSGLAMSRVVSLDKKLYLKFSLFTQADDIMVRVTGFPWSASSVLGGIAMFSLVSLPAKENQGLTSGRVKPQWLLCEFERSKKKD